MKEGKKRNKPAASGVITLACALALGAEAQGDAAQARKERKALETALASWPYPGENEAVRQQLRWYEEKRRCAQNKA